MSEEKIVRTFATKMPDKPGAFLLACKVIMNHDGNIVRVSFNKGVNLFIEVSATREQLNAIDLELSDISYVDYMPKQKTILVMEVRITDRPGALFPVLKIIDKYDVNISYLNSSADNREYQHFNIGMEVENPTISKKILDEVSELYALDVPSYNGSNDDLDITVSYIRLANMIQKLFDLDEDKVKEFIAESTKIAKFLKDNGLDPKEAFEGIKQLANFIAFHRDLNFKPKISEYELTPETTLHVIEPPCGSNTYILRHDDSLLFVDTGLGIYSDEMITELREMFPCFFSMEKTILVTHADVDHCGILSVIENAKIIATKKTAEMLDNIVGDIKPNSDLFSQCYGRLGKIITDYTAPSKDSLCIIGKDAPEDHDDLLRIDTVRFGDIELEVYEGSGGHLPGETVYFCREPKILFTGDIYSNLKELTPERADFENIAPFLLTNMDVDPEKLKNVRSQIGRLMDETGRSGMIVCGGHGGIKKL